MTKNISNPRLLISRYFDSLINTIDVYAEEQLEKFSTHGFLDKLLAEIRVFQVAVLMDSQNQSNEPKFDFTKLTIREYINKIRQDMIDLLRSEESVIYKRYDLIRIELKSIKYQEENSEEENVDQLMSKLFTEKFFFIFYPRSFSINDANKIKVFDLELFVVDYYIDRIEKCFLRKTFDKNYIHGYLFFGLEKLENISKKLIKQIDPDIFLKINLDKIKILKYIRSLLTGEFLIAKLISAHAFSSSYYKHVIYAKQSDSVYSEKEITISENLFKFQQVNLNEEKYPNLESLEFQNSSKKSKIIWENLSSFDNLKRLELQNVQLIDTSFRDLTKLEELKLLSCDFKSFTSESFQYVPNIEKLIVKNSTIFFPITFKHLSHLKNLTVDINYHNSELSYLNMLSESLETLVIENSLDNPKLAIFFDKIKNLKLKTLELHINGKNFFNDEWMSTLESVKNLTIICQKKTKNNLNLRDDLMPNLERLKIKSIHMANLNAIGFVQVKLSNLKTFELENFKIKCKQESVNLENGQKCQNCLNKSMLVDLPNLTQLNFRNNQLSDIEPTTFIHTPNLTQLSFCDNLLTILRKEMFSPIENLNLLDLSNNKIEALDDGVFSNLKKLKILILNSNPINRRLSETTFEGLESLVELEMNDTLLDRIEPINLFAANAQLNRVWMNTVRDWAHHDEIEGYYNCHILFNFF